MFHVKHSADDTIAAIITPRGIGGVGTVRLSGDKALLILKKIFQPTNKKAKFLSHKLNHGWIVAPKSKKRVDEVMAAYMSSPKTYTGENTVEITGHGGAAVMSKIINIVIKTGARLAERGEFTKRAFLNGKIDLSQAEAVMDIITAKNVQGVEVAAEQLFGRLTNEVGKIRSDIMSLTAQLEAGVDFPDDIGVISGGRLKKWIERAGEQIKQLLQTSARGRLVRVGARVAIVGKPNVGKSSLMNSLLGEGRVIVSSQPGTTRDIIEEEISINDLPVVLIDMAGMRKAGNEVEAEGIERARAEASRADLTLMVIDGHVGLDGNDRMIIREADQRKAVVVINKVDLGINADNVQAIRGFPQCKVSALTGAGIGGLRSKIARKLMGSNLAGGEVGALINARHQEALERAQEALVRAIRGIDENVPIDILSIELKGAIIALGEIGGEEVSEKMINEIFARFCVGK